VGSSPTTGSKNAQFKGCADDERALREADG